MNLPQVPNYPAAAACQHPDSCQPRAGRAVGGERLPSPLFPTALPLQCREEERSLKGAPQGCAEVKDCLEEKAEVKIKKRGSARRVQTGAGAITAEDEPPLTCPGATVGSAHSQTGFN